MFAVRAEQTTATTGTGTVDLDSPATSRVSLAGAIGTGKKVYYCIQTSDGSAWEYGIGTVTSGTPDTLTRDTIIKSSNSNALVNFPSGTKTVGCVENGDTIRFQHAGQIPTAGGTADVATVAFDPPVRHLRDGMEFIYRAGGSITVTTPTVNFDGLGAKTIKRYIHSAALAVGDIVSNQVLRLMYDGTNDVMVLTSPITATPIAVGDTLGAITDVASATTTDIGAQATDHINITGTTTITGLGTATAGKHRTLRFAGALTLTHNATSLQLPGGENIVTAAGDTAEAVSLGSGNWRVYYYTRASEAYFTIASATTTDLKTSSSPAVLISGTTTITGFGTAAAGVRKWIKFTGALTLTHNATSLILPDGQNITTAAGDTAEAISEGSGNWRVINYLTTRKPQGGNQCKLIKSSTNLSLEPFNGDTLWVNGILYNVTSGSHLLGTGGLSSSTLYYIYAYISSGAIALEASATAPAAGSRGYKIKNGDATRTLVGMARTNGSTAWVDSESQRFTRSWFNDNGVQLSAAFSTDRTTTSTSGAELNTEIRVEVLTWLNETVRFGYHGSMTGSGAGQENSTAIALDGSVITPGAFHGQGTTKAVATSSGCKSDQSEGYHYYTVFGQVSAGTGTWYGTGRLGVTTHR